MIILATIGGVLVALFWGVSDYLSGKSGQHSDEYLTNFIVQVMGAVFLLPIVLWKGLPLNIDLNLFIIFLISVLFTIAYVSFVKSLAIGPFGVAAPLANSYALVTIVFGLLFLGFNISLVQIGIFLVIIFSILLLAVDKTTFNIKNFRKSTLYFAGLAAVTWGIAFALVDVVAHHYAWYELLFLIGVFASVLGFLYYILIRKRIPSFSDLGYQNMKLAWRSGVLLFIGSVAFFATTDLTGSVVIPAVLASASPLVTSLMAAIHDQEELTSLKRLGAVLIVVSIMALNIL